MKRARNIELLDIQSQISLDLHKSYTGKELEVLVEGESRLRQKSQPGEVKLGWSKPAHDLVRLVGRTEGDEIVAFTGPRSMIGSMRTVRATGATNLTIQAELVRSRSLPLIGEQERLSL